MRLSVQTGIKGVDNLIAGTALVQNLLVVTRSVKDFEISGVRVCDRLAGLKTDAVTNEGAANPAGKCCQYK